MLPAVVPVLLAVAVIVIAELHDRKSNARQQRILKEGFRATGTVKTVERIPYRRGVYRWSISVEFEYSGNTYFLERFSVIKPALYEGCTVTVYVDRKDPWKSYFI